MIYVLKPVCKKDWKRKNGTSLIFIQYCRGANQRVIVDTKIAIPPQYWNRKLIMKISGHRSLKDFYRYIKVTPDQAAFQIEKIWKERELTAAI